MAEQQVLVLDEPIAHLDHPTAVALAEDLLTGPRQQAVLWITHGGVGLDLLDRVVDLGTGPWPGPESPASGTTAAARETSNGSPWKQSM